MKKDKESQELISDRYRILDKLGEGGMALVYKVHDTRLNSDVAVKVIRVDNLPPRQLMRALKRFQLEAKSLGQLTHPNIVKVQEFGEHKGNPYIVMPYIPGGDLKQKIVDHPMEYREAARMLIPIARALAYAHREGVVHRDIKPANILLTDSDEPMLTDFGIAQFSEEETLDLTGTNTIVGTPEYMSPEQAMGEDIDYRTDIYSLGVVYFEMVTGRKPFDAETPVAVMTMHSRDRLPRPRKYVSNLSDRVEKVLMKALAKNPDQRHQSADDFADALEEIISETSMQRRMRYLGKLAMRMGFAGISLAVVSWLLMFMFEGQKNSSPDLIPTFTATKTLVATSTLTPTSSPTSLPTSTPTVDVQLPVYVGTPMPMPEEAIEVLNIDRLELLALLGKNAVEEIAYSPRGDLVAVSYSLSGIIFYDPATGEEARGIEYKPKAVDMKFSQDGSLLAFIGDDDIVNIWEMTEFVPMQSFAESQSFDIVAISPDNKSIAVGNSKGFLDIWNLSDGEKYAELRTKNFMQVDDLFFAPDSNYLVIISDQVATKNIAILSLVEKKWEPFSRTGVTAAISSDTSLIAVARDNGSIYLWPLFGDTIQETFTVGEGDAREIIFSQDDNYLAAVFTDGNIRIWSLKTLKLIFEESGWGEISFLINGNLENTFGNKVLEWDINTHRVVNEMEFQSYRGDASFPPFQRNSSYDVTWAKNSCPGSVGITTNDYYTLWEISTTDNLFKASIRRNNSNKIKLQSLVDENKSATLIGHEMAISTFDLSPDNKVLASSDGRSVLFWTMPDGIQKKSAITEQRVSGISCLQYSPDGKYLLMSNSRQVLIWDLIADQLLYTLESNQNYKAMAVSPNSQIVALLTDKNIQLWNIIDGRLLKYLLPRQAERYSRMSSMYFSSKGDLLTLKYGEYNSEYVHVWGISP